MRYMREPLSSTTSPGRACARSHAIASSLPRRSRARAARARRRARRAARSAAKSPPTSTMSAARGRRRADAFVHRAAPRRPARPCCPAPRCGARRVRARTPRAWRARRSSRRCTHRRSRSVPPACACARSGRAGSAKCGARRGDGRADRARPPTRRRARRRGCGGCDRRARRRAAAARAISPPAIDEHVVDAHDRAARSPVRRPLGVDAEPHRRARQRRRHARARRRPRDRARRARRREKRSHFVSARRSRAAHDLEVRFADVRQHGDVGPRGGDERRRGRDTCARPSRRSRRARRRRRARARTSRTPISLFSFSGVATASRPAAANALSRRTPSSSSCRCCRVIAMTGPRRRARASRPSVRYAGSVSATTIAGRCRRGNAAASSTIAADAPRSTASATKRWPSKRSPRSARNVSLGRDRARVGRHGDRGRQRSRLTTRPPSAASDVVRGQSHARSVPERDANALAYFVAIVERHALVADDLIGFVAFAGNDDGVAGARVLDRARESPCAGRGSLRRRCRRRRRPRSAAGSSPRGLSDVTITASAAPAAIAPISTRCPASRSPPQPNTTISRPRVVSRAARSTFASASGVCA